MERKAAGMTPSRKAGWLHYTTHLLHYTSSSTIPHCTTNYTTHLATLHSLDHTIHLTSPAEYAAR